MNSEDIKERRKYERISFVEDILIDYSRTTTSLDLSEGGMYISTVQFYEKNSVIDVIIPFKGKKLTLKAQVQYSHPGIGMGVMFVALNDMQKAHIRELIESIKKKPAGSAISGKDILLVEDNDKSRKAIKGALFKEGFSVIEACNGLEAMKSIAERHIDLVILDLYMKEMDGLKVLSLLKTDMKWKDVPVIICSAYDAQNIRDKVMNAGADEFLSKKSTSPANLVQSVRLFLGQCTEALQE